MPFSKLLLICANSRKYIEGHFARDKVLLEKPREGEVALFFKIDENKVKRSLNMDGHGTKCCDGLIFYAHDEQSERIICLVEMKSAELNKAAEQISHTYENVKRILDDECKNCKKYIIGNPVIWKACIYNFNSSGDERKTLKKYLEEKCGFKHKNIEFLDRDNRDIGPLLRSENALNKEKKGKRQ